MEDCSQEVRRLSYAYIPQEWYPLELAAHKHLDKHHGVNGIFQVPEDAPILTSPVEMLAYLERDGECVGHFEKMEDLIEDEEDRKAVQALLDKVKNARAK